MIFADKEMFELTLSITEPLGVTTCCTNVIKPLDTKNIFRKLLI